MNVPCSKSKSGSNDMTYNSENIHDDVYYSLLKQAYDMYNLFLGDFHSFVENDRDTSNLKLKLHQFFTRVRYTKHH